MALVKISSRLIPLYVPGFPKRFNFSAIMKDQVSARCFEYDSILRRSQLVREEASSIRKEQKKKRERKERTLKDCTR